MIPQLLELGTFLLLAMPLSIGLGLGFCLLLRIRPPERWVKQVSGAYFVASVILVILLFSGIESTGKRLFWSYPLLQKYKIDLVLTLDRFSLIYSLMSASLVGLIGRFAFSYLHREEGFHRFFLLLHFAAFGLQLALCAGCIDLLWIGWEFLGISSVFLVTFFYERKGPVDNGLYIFFVYRIGDLSLLTVGLWLHSALGTTNYDQILTSASVAKLQSGGFFSTAFFLGLLITTAAVVKASLFPFINWLPRAMEGPTPSSAVFYGALSTHLGIFLLIRLYPLLQTTPGILPLLFLLGAASVVLGTLFGLVQTDAKNSLADATIVQLGLMLMELAMGWVVLAQIHLFSHAILRAYQFLRVPSTLQMHHETLSLYGENFSVTGMFTERFLPARFRNWLYFVALERAFFEAVFERLIVRPVFRISRWLNQKEEKVTASLFQEESNPSSSSKQKIRLLSFESKKEEILAKDLPASKEISR